MNAGFPSVEGFSRPAKALIDRGAAPTFDDAAKILAGACPNVVAGPDAVTHAHQAALLTAIEATVRAFGDARVHLPAAVAGASCTVPGNLGATIADVIAEAGGNLVTTAEIVTAAPTIVVGTVPEATEMTLQITWDQWFAHVDIGGRRLPERGNMVLAAVAAAGIAVTECFRRVLGTLEACQRNRSLNLWRPDAPIYPTAPVPLGYEFIGPDLRYLPSSVWMVGLGHLGQGYAWCWRLLPYADPSACEILLQDFDKVNPANQTTGMFVRDGDTDRMKTRVIADVLERAGFKTRIVERRLLTDTRRGTTEPPLALIGVDKVEPRHLISDVGWTLAVDVGLGAGPIDFTGISIHTFPAPTPSTEVPAWQGSGASQRAERAQEQAAYRAARADGADACGLIQIAETAVAAPFVGVVAACLALAEPLRVLHGQHPNTTLTFDVGRSAPPRSTPGVTSPRIAYQAAGADDATPIRLAGPTEPRLMPHHGR